MDKYTSLLTVTVPPGGTVTVPHDLRANGAPAEPMVVMPNAGTALKVAGIDPVNVTFQNPSGASPLTATFLCVFLHSVQSLLADVPPGSFLWQGPGAGAAAAAGVFWEPGGPGAVQTWADVLAIVSASEVPLPIYTSNRFATPTIPAASGTSDLHWSWFQSQFLGGLGQTTIEVEDGAVLHNLWGCVGNVGLHLHPTTGPCLTFTTVGGNPAILSMLDTAGMQNSGTVPAMQIADGSLAVLLVRLAGGFVTGTAPIINVGVGSVGIVGILDGGVFPDDVVSSTDATGVLVVQTGGTGPSPLPTQAGFTGTQLFAPQGPCASWTTAGRPVGAFGPLPVGLTGYNVTLGTPEWWDGAAWVQIVTGGPPGPLPVVADFPDGTLPGAGGSATDTPEGILVQATGGLLLFAAQTKLQVAPAAPWTTYFRILADGSGRSNLMSGPVYVDNATGAMFAWSLTGNLGGVGGYSWEQQEWTSPAVRTVAVNKSAPLPTGVWGYYGAYGDDGVNFFVASSMSARGPFQVIATVAKAGTVLAAGYDRRGLFANGYNAAAPVLDAVGLCSWFRPTPPTF